MNARRQQGAATLVVVMVLFFIISMVAAYTSRNMIFEQRTGANLYRATQSLEAAEAGLEWATMMLNTGRIDEDCVASTDTSDNTFRSRYVTANASTGLLTARTKSDGTELTPTCRFDHSSGRWICSCPADGDPALAAPAGDEVSPAFRVRFRTLNIATAQPGLMRVEVVGCTRLDNACLALTGPSVVNEGRTVVGSVVLLSGRAMVMPRAALTARGNVTAASLAVSNVRVADGGITVHASGSIDPGLSLTTISGNASGGSTIPSDSVLELPALSPFSAAQRFFASIFLLPPERWAQLPGVFTVNCGVGGCNAATIRDVVAANPGRPLWINGDVSVDSAGDIGTATSPVLMVVNGNLSFSITGVTIHGLLMLRPSDPTTGWATSGDGRINGAVIVDGPVTGSGTLRIEYNGNVLTAVRSTVGNLSRVAGSWRDWAMQ
jgi:type II secretory pathway pseudopilin PulG